MFIGHAAVAMAAKPLAPRLNLGIALIAAFWLDLIWPLLLLLGIERVRIDPGNTAFTPLDFVHYPWSHSLLAAVAWALLFGAACLPLGRRAAVLLGLLVFSHWLLDFISHRPDLPLWPGRKTMLGLGLWRSVAATLAVESTMFVVGLWLYARSAPARDKAGFYGFWGLISVLVLAYFANAFGPPPPNVEAIAIAGLLVGPVFGLWAWWADRHRGLPA